VEVCFCRVSLNLVGVPSYISFIICDGCFSHALVIWGLSIMTLLQQALLREALTVTHLRLVRELVVVRWFKNIFVIFITFGFSCTAIDEYNKLVDFSQKNKLK
jgi:hypothetical protein